MPRKPPKGKSLAEVNPELANQWHPTKNGDFTPFDVMPGSGARAWWKCPEVDDHEWETSVLHRTKNNSNCPICSGHKVVRSTCLAITHPDLVEEWHPNLNIGLSPFKYGSGSNKKIWWKCPKGDDHEWITSVSNRNSGRDCIYCQNRKVSITNSLATINPELAQQWHSTKNGKLTPNDVVAGSHKKVWWKCPKGNDHEWVTSVNHRLNGTGCSVCKGKKVVKSNCLATTHPEIAEQWHPTKNGELTPNDVVSGFAKRVWWKCDKGDDHEWIASPNTRKESGCPICVGQKVVLSNCLATTHPKIAKQWHPTKNGDLTATKIVAGSQKKVWWKCDKGEDHEWRIKSASRLFGSGCPFCTLTPQSKQELTITFELLKLFKDINPRGFKSKINGKVRSVDIYIPHLQLVIEFDGSYWHKGKREFDKLKTKQLQEGGFKVIRIRAQDKLTKLKKITKNDVISKTPFNAKEVTNNVLKQIMKMYALDAKKIAKIEPYIAKKELQNEKGLDKYIDMILTEKAEKKAIK
ncbi:zinc-ribbon domain-containing protein [Flavobacteriales bacterium]|nr:zinc-ribbon domain-containing protein [Flavobacteriales bacterium]